MGVINVAKNMAKITVEPDQQEILIESEFDAPQELVFKASIWMKCWRR
jgi:hypothetical protein